MIALLSSWLVSASIKGSLLVAMALVVAYLLRRRIPSRWLCALLLVAIARLLLPVAPQARFSAFNLMRDAAIATPGIRVAAAAPVRARTPHVEAERVPMFIAPPSWTRPLLALWFAGLLLFAARMFVRTFTFRRRLRHARAIDHPDVARLLDEGRDALRVHRSVRVLESGAVSTPALHGWLQPALLLPEGFLTTFSAEQLRYVVLHELAHVRRADVLVNWLVTAAQALHWFNPLIHLAAARLAEERELACDALALDALRDHERVAYGGTMLELLNRLRPMSPAPAVVGMTSTKRQLHRRIQMIASFRKSRHSLAFAAGVLAVGLLTLTDATAGERTQPRIQIEPLSPAAQAVVEKLEQKFTAELTSVSIEDVAHDLSNATGVAIQYADGALTDDVRNARITVKSKDAPAHLVLVESFSQVNLAVRFNDNGVLVEPMPAAEKVFTHTGPAPIHGDGRTANRVFVRTSEGMPIGSGEIVIAHDDTNESRREIRFRGKFEKDGEFELEVKRDQ